MLGPTHAMPKRSRRQIANPTPSFSAILTIVSAALEVIISPCRLLGLCLRFGLCHPLASYLLCHPSPYPESHGYSVPAYQYEQSIYRRLLSFPLWMFEEEF